MPFTIFSQQDIIEILNKYGVETVVERGGRIFPVSNKSVDVLNALLSFAKEHKAEFYYNCKVSSLLIRRQHHWC